MSNVRDCERARGVAEWKLNMDIRRLVKDVNKDNINPRTVANLAKAVDTAYEALMDAHIAYVLKLNSDLNEARHIQFVEKYMDAVERSKEKVGLILGTANADGEPIAATPDVSHLKEN